MQVLERTTRALPFRGPDRRRNGVPMTVFTVSGDPLFREGLRRLLADAGLLPTGMADDATSLPKLGAPRVTLMALSADACDPVEDIARIRKVWPATRILALVHEDRQDLMVAALRAGADGCLGRETSPEAIAQAIRLIGLGENLMPVRLSQILIGDREPARDVSLTPRERDVLRGLLAGHSNKMIAKTLGTTDMTVKAQLRHLLRKIGASNRTQAALWARENASLVGAAG